ncbi:M48 family metallopeptidase [bacterium]|nr:M48 family metallopeptidase [bacterium]
MNLYAIIILASLLLDFALSFIADCFNLKTLTSKLPDPFRDVYNAQSYRKSQIYTRTRTYFAWVAGAVQLGLILLFWFCRGFPALDDRIHALNLHPVWDGLIFIGILMLGRSFLHLPFTAYETFIIEARFGFNKTTWRTFLTDLLKVLLLSILIGGPVAAGILSFFLYTGKWAWLYCWMATFAVSLLFQYVAPAWILPWFNRFTPLEKGELRTRIQQYAKKIGFRISGIYSMNGSRRSSKTNAFFTGFGRHKRIVLYDTLIARHSVPELVAVLAHEIGHYKKKHIFYHMLIGVLHSGFLFYLLSVFLNHPGLYEAFYMDRMPLHAGFIFFGLLYSPIEMILSFFINHVSRKMEYRADRFALESTHDADSFVSALKKLSANNLTNLKPHPLYVFLNHSHPPVLKRIETLQSLKNQLD